MLPKNQVSNCMIECETIFSIFASLAVLLIKRSVNQFLSSLTWHGFIPDEYEFILTWCDFILTWHDFMLRNAGNPRLVLPG